MSPPSLRNLKRGQIAVADIGPPSKRTRSSTASTDQRFVREASPNKNVHFPRNLILGPHAADPRRRSLSPARSALRRPNTACDSPSLQLLGEQALASTNSKTQKTQNPPRQRRVAGRKSDSEVVDESTDGFVDPAMDDGRAIVSSATHDNICDLVHELKSRIERFATSFPNGGKPDGLTPLLKIENRQLIRYLGLLAIGGKGGRRGWQDLLSDPTCRSALISGIIGRALKENVFDELYFGADAELSERLSEHEQDCFQHDSFFRSRQRASIIFKHEKKRTSAATLKKAVAYVALQLERLLFPLWTQGGTFDSWKKSQRRDELAAIVADAADISHNMRKDFDSVYYWPPTFKDEEFEPERMDCSNIYAMICNSPYDIQKTSAGSERPILRQGRKYEDTALVRVMCFPGLVSYQQGGGELAQREQISKKKSKNAPGQDQNGDSCDGGFRTRILCKSDVLLQWGSQRILTREAGTSAHRTSIKSGDGKYEKDQAGFVELYDLFLEAVTQDGHSPPEDTALSPRHSWLPSVTQLFTRSPSAQPGRS